MGAPNNADEAGLQRLATQLKSGKVVVKLFLRHLPFHAKLYLVHRPDPNNPTIGFVGSSNLTLAGLSKQGELNVDVLDHDACNKLKAWFEDQWNDQWCLDISKELSEIIDTSRTREEPVPPYHIYLKMAYHLSPEARAGLNEYHLPREFSQKLLPFQSAAVRIAAHYVNKRNGVVIGDVVGLGKTLMAAALARVLQEQGLETLIICPKNLAQMWNDYIYDYQLNAKVMSLSTVLSELPEKTRRYQEVVKGTLFDTQDLAKAIDDIYRYISQNTIIPAVLEWDKMGVHLTPTQFEFARTKGSEFWLYVVENARSERPSLYCFQNPFSQIDQYRFDGGWKVLSDATESTGAPVNCQQFAVGVHVSMDDSKRGELRGVVEEIETSGAIKRFTILLADGTRLKKCLDASLKVITE